MTQCSGSICGLYPLDVSSTCCSGLSNVFLKDKSILGQEPPAYSYTRKPRFSHSWVSNTVLTSRLLQHPVPTRHFPDGAWSRPGRSSSLLLTAAAAPYAKRVGEALVLHAQKCGRDQGRRDPHGRAVRGPPRITNPNSELRQMLQQQRKLLFLHLFPPLASLLLRALYSTSHLCQQWRSLLGSELASHGLMWWEGQSLGWQCWKLV